MRLYNFRYSYRTPNDSRFAKPNHIGQRKDIYFQDRETFYTMLDNWSNPFRPKEWQYWESEEDKAYNDSLGGTLCRLPKRKNEDIDFLINGKAAWLSGGEFQPVKEL